MDYRQSTSDSLRLQLTNALEMRKKLTGVEVEYMDITIGEIEDELHKRGEPVGNGIKSFKKPTQIRYRKRDASLIVPTGINGIDNKIKGVNLGEVSIWSGSNASGKSSILSQLAITAIEDGRKVALFSGELTDDRVMNWIQLQCAGKQYALPTDFENFFKVDFEVRKRINEWLDDRLYIYDNDSGMKATSVLNSINDCITEYGINVVILDNLMSLDLSMLHGDKNENQTKLVLSLAAMAKKRNVHIHFVAHPRKSMGFLRKDDIAGTADITNAADNVFIIHRVGNDFKSRFKEYMGAKDDSPFFKFSNVVEICKNRDIGIVDEFVGLYYEKESKRFLNYPNEQKHYGWEQDKDGFVQADEELKFE